MENFKTGLKTLPTILRVVIGLIGVAGLPFLFVIVRALIHEPTTLLLIMTIAYSTITFLFLGFGLFSIKTFELGNRELIESFLWGLFKVRTPLEGIEAFKSHMVSNKLGTFEELIVNKKNGDTIFIQASDQRQFPELKSRLTQLFREDKAIEPNYWTPFIKISAILLVIWVGLMITVKIIGQ